MSQFKTQFIITSLLSKDFTFDVVLGEKILEKLKGGSTNFTKREKIPGKNISSFNTLKDKTRQAFAGAFEKLKVKNDFDIYYEITT